jgi:hypothetical protein
MADPMTASRRVVADYQITLARAYVVLAEVDYELRVWAESLRREVAP